MTIETQKTIFKIISAAAEKLMGWQLPHDFYPDGYISFDAEKARQGVQGWPTGTNLLHVQQAREMFTHCVMELLDAELSRREAEVEALGTAIHKAIEDEPELPGEMPEVMFLAMKNLDREGMTEALRILVRETKYGILARFQETTK